MLPVTITPTSINLLLDGRMRTLQKGHINFEAVKVALRDLSSAFDERETADVIETLRELLDIPAFIARVTEGRVQVGDGAVMFDGQPVQGVIATRLMAMLAEGMDVRPLARFLDRVSNNPIQTARDEIYLWLESGNLPLCEDGAFLAFKKVKSDYSSSHLNPDGSQFFNFVGTTVTMPGGREAVDPNRHQTCSTGLHFCSFQYLSAFGLGGESKVIIVKVNPEDVVSIPSDYNNSKGRAWKYAIIGEVPEDECKHLFDNRPVVDHFGYYDQRDLGDEDDDGYSDYDEIDDDHFHVPVEDEDDGHGCSSCACDVHDDDDYLSDDDSEADDEPATLTFKHGKRTFDADQITQLVEDYGQRGVAKLIKVPRTTLQGWLAQIKEVAEA